MMNVRYVNEEHAVRKLYQYVGSHDLFALLHQPSDRKLIQQPSDVLQWMRHTKQRLARDQTLTVTFIIDVHDQLWIADRHSEHVVCANGQAVKTAGEMTLLLEGHQIGVIAMTNQSTGYCPEPESWHVVAAVCDCLGIPHPDTWTTAYHFRRCAACESTNIIKDDWFVCAVCQQDLSTEWNYG